MVCEPYLFYKTFAEFPMSPTTTLLDIFFPLPQRVVSTNLDARFLTEAWGRPHSLLLIYRREPLFPAFAYDYLSLDTTL